MTGRFTFNIPDSVETHDNTMFDDYARCPFLYSIRHHRGLATRPIGGAGFLEFGSLIHDGLAEYYKGLSEGVPYLECRNEALKVMHATPYEDPIDSHRTKGRAMMAMADYADKWKDDPTLKIIFTETSFEIIDKETGLRYGGRIDLVAQHEKKIWPVDHKTSSAFGNTYFDQFKSAPQMAGYVWATWKLHGHMPAGAIINNLTIRGNKESKNEFHRLPIHYSPAFIEQWVEDTFIRYADVTRALESGVYERRRFNCTNKWGKCSAWNVCHGLPQNVEKNIRIDFVRDKWNFRDRD